MGVRVPPPNAVAARHLFGDECPPTAIGLPLPVYTSVCGYIPTDEWHPINGTLNLLLWLAAYALICFGLAATTKFIARHQRT